MTRMTPRTPGHPAAVVRRSLCIAALLFAIAASGCSYLRPNRLPYAKLALPYAHTQLRTTSSLEVLSLAHDPAYHFPPRVAEPVLLTQSDTAVAFSGQSRNRRKIWLDLIAFDELRMVAARKYFFCIDERATADPDRPHRPLIPPRKGILFDSEFAIDPEVLTTPYATEEAQKIAILKWLAERFKNDVTILVGNPKSPAQGNEQVTASAMMVNQMFQGILTELAQSPGLATSLAADQGIAFPHMSLKEGRLRLLVANETAVLTIRINLPMTPLQ
jgi:hypothetical protein